jgi:hypothetical protein
LVHHLLHQLAISPLERSTELPQQHPYVGTIPVGQQRLLLPFEQRLDRSDNVFLRDHNANAGCSRKLIVHGATTSGEEGKRRLKLRFALESIGPGVRVKIKVKNFEDGEGEEVPSTRGKRGHGVIEGEKKENENEEMLWCTNKSATECWDRVNVRSDCQEMPGDATRRT